MAFTELFLKILPLYVLILIGFMVGRQTKLLAADLAPINLYYIAPLIFFDAMSHLPFQASNILLPLICLGIMCLVAAIFFYGTRVLSKDKTMPYWLAASGPTINTGYYGIPVFLMMFGIDHLGSYMVYTFGGVIFTYTITNYFFMRNHYNFKDALMKILKLPVLHAMLLGVVCQLIDFRLPVVFDPFFTMLRNAYVVMGMMVIGLVLSRQTENRSGLVFDWRLILSTNIIRYIFYPALALGVVVLNRQVLHLFPTIAEQIIVLVSILPMGADTTSLAAQWKTHPERIAALTLVSSLIALVMIPFLLPILLRF